MSTDSAIKNIVDNMPDALKTELLHYAEYLITKSSALQQSEETKVKDITVKKPLAGSMKGTFVLPLSDDFDAPLEDFEDYSGVQLSEIHP